jgi:hypothetical protein
MNVVLILLLCIFVSNFCEARDLNDDSSLKLLSSIKVTGLGSAPSSDPSLSGDGSSGAGFLRLRLEPEYHKNAWVVDIAYENRLFYMTGNSLGISSALPSTAPVPYRIYQIGGYYFQGNLSGYQQLDRAFVSYQTDSVSLTLGRQAVGWGRGTAFSAVDIFAPFTPLQIDQEWRSGVDAFRADIKLSHTTSLDVVSAWANSWDQSALGARLRGYFGNIDGELVVAKRATDMMYGVTSSANVVGAELHGEFAVFQTPGDIPGTGFLGNSALVPKAVLGASNNFNLGSGLKILVEYHYSGFGAATDSDFGPLLANPSFQARLLRGDTQILGRQALLVTPSYDLSPEIHTSLQYFQSLMDAAGIFAPSVIWDISDSASLLASVFVAYGASSINGVPQSQFGAVPPTAIAQLRVYD